MPRVDAYIHSDDDYQGFDISGILSRTQSKLGYINVILEYSTYGSKKSVILISIQPCGVFEGAWYVVYKEANLVREIIVKNNRLLNCIIKPPPELLSLIIEEINKRM